MRFRYLNLFIKSFLFIKKGGRNMLLVRTDWFYKGKIFTFYTSVIDMLPIFKFIY